MVTYNDILVTRNGNGSYTLRALVNGYFERQTYHGYTLRQSRKLFYDFINGQGL